MLFTEVRFALLVIGCWVTLAVVPAARRGAALAIWGAAFYVIYAPAATPLAFGLIALTFVCGRRCWWAATIVVLAALAYYKSGRLLMPLGLSFLAFELVHFAIERHRGRPAPAGLADYLAFALYFPCRVAGPIKRYPDFEKAVASARPSVVSVYDGLLRILIGLAKKLVLADFLGLTVAEMAYAETRAQVAKVILAYSFQIYLDFSAYSDLAIGVSRLFGIAIPENFRWPYLSGNIQDFWTRWHISLSSWVRDYIFLPFGRYAFGTGLRRRPLAIAALGYLIAFLAVGAWHGLTANFLLWGAYHGALLGAHHAYRKTIAARLATYAIYQSTAAAIASTLLTFGAVTLGWILFLTPDLPQALRVLRLLAGRA